MSQYDVCRSRSTRALVVDCQSDCLSHLPTRFVVPLLALAEAPGVAEGLNPILTFDNEEYYLAPQYAATVRTSDLERGRGSLAREHLTITSALAFLIGSF